MPKTIFSSCKEMLSKADKKVITLEQLRMLIQIHIGSQRGTIEQALRVMGSTGLIKDIGECKFEVL